MLISTVYTTTTEAIFPYVETELVRESHHSRFYNYDLHDLDEEDLRRPLISAAENMPSGGMTHRGYEYWRPAI